jgi:hypothetical protein
MEHMEAPEPSSAGRWIRSCRLCGSTGALLNGETMSGAMGHMAARPAPCLGLMHVCGGTQSAGYRHYLILIVFFCFFLLGAM